MRKNAAIPAHKGVPIPEHPGWTGHVEYSPGRFIEYRKKSSPRKGCTVVSGRVPGDQKLYFTAAKYGGKYGWGQDGHVNLGRYPSRDAAIAACERAMATPMERVRTAPKRSVGGRRNPHDLSRPRSAAEGLPWPADLLRGQSPDYYYKQFIAYLRAGREDDSNVALQAQSDASNTPAMRTQVAREEAAYGRAMRRERNPDGNDRAIPPKEFSLLIDALQRSHAAGQRWIAAGRPRPSPLYDAYNEADRDLLRRETEVNWPYRASAEQGKEWSYWQKHYRERAEAEGLKNPRNPQDAARASATILQQLGGSGKVNAMLGRPAMHYGTSSAGPYLSIKFKSPHRGPNHVKITLTPADTYNVEFSKVVKYDLKPAGTYTDIYAEQLRPLFERVTGLYLSLGSMGRNNPKSRTGERAGKRRSNPRSGTVAAFLAVLVSKLTQYDMREQKKHYNLYRLGHLLGAADEIRADLKNHLGDDSPAALAALKQSIAARFTLPFPPASATIKQIDAYLATGKYPSLVRNSAKSGPYGPTGTKQWWFRTFPDDKNSPLLQPGYYMVDMGPFASKAEAVAAGRIVSALGTLHMRNSKFGPIVSEVRGRKAKKRANPKFSIHDISAFANHPMMDTEDSPGPPLRDVLGSYYGHAVASPADFRAIAVWISDYLKRRPTASNRTLLTRVAREFWRQSGVKSAR